MAGKREEIVPPASVPLEPLLTCSFTLSFNKHSLSAGSVSGAGDQQRARPTRFPPSRLYNPAMQTDKKAGDNDAG